MMKDRGQLKELRKKSAPVTFHPPLSHMGLSSRFCSEKPITNLLSYNPIKLIGFRDVSKFIQ
jgi:hypothetical protein